MCYPRHPLFLRTIFEGNSAVPKRRYIYHQSDRSDRGGAGTGQSDGIRPADEPEESASDLPQGGEAKNEDVSLAWVIPCRSTTGDAAGNVDGVFVSLSEASRPLAGRAGRGSAAGHAVSCRCNGERRGGLVGRCVGVRRVMPRHAGAILIAPTWTFQGRNGRTTGVEGERRVASTPGRDVSVARACDA